MGGVTTALEQFFKKLHDDDATDVTANPVAWFDSLLSQVSQIIPVAARTVMDVSGVTSAVEKANMLSEIERQLFLQFLLSERSYLRGHHIMTGLELYRKFSVDQQICQQKQAQITNVLTRILNIEGIGAGAYTALTVEQGETLIAFVKMNFTQQQFTTMTSLDDFLNNRETGAVRRVLEQAFEHYADPDTVKFRSRDAWIDMAKRWNGWASKHDERIAALKELWDAMGGGKDLNSNPEALKVIDDYYQDLYAQIESGNTIAWLRMIDQRVSQ